MDKKTNETKKVNKLEAFVNGDIVDQANTGAPATKAVKTTKVNSKVKESKPMEYVPPTTKPRAKTAEELEESLGITISFEEHIDKGEDEDTFHAIITSNRVEKRIKCRLADIKEVPYKLMASGHFIDVRDFGQLINLKVQKIIASSHFHSTIGWDIYKGEVIFKYRNIMKADGCLNSEYRGKIDIKQSGSMCDYIEGIKKLVVPYPKFNIIFLAGLTGILGQMLKISDINIMLNIAGTSSSGKSTAERLALSAWGNSQNLWATFNSTEDGIESVLVDRVLVPVVIDDFIGAKKEDTRRAVVKFVNNQIFRFSTGVGKQRFEKDSAKNYSSVITSTEAPLAGILASSSSEGQFYRFLELNITQGDLTQGEEGAKELDRLTRQNHGHIASKLGDFMVKQGYVGEKLETSYYDMQEDIANDARLKKHFRAANRLAVIMLTGQLVNECFDLGIDLDKVRETLIDSVLALFKAAEAKNQAYYNLRETVENNKQMFANSTEEYSDTLHVGVYKRSVYGSMELLIEPERLAPLIQGVDLKSLIANKSTGKQKESLKDSDFFQILRSWREQGWLIAEASGGRFTARHRFKAGDKQQRIYRIVFENEVNTNES